MDDKQNVRKHLVFLLNYVLDTSKKPFVHGDDLVMVSNEVRNFNTYLEKSTIDSSLKKKLEKIKFDYSPKRAELMPVFLLIFLTITTLGIYLIFFKLQELERKRMLVSFLNKYEELLKLF